MEKQAFVYWGSCHSHVLHSTPLHVLAAFDPPKAVVKILESLFIKFFYGEVLNLGLIAIGLMERLLLFLIMRVVLVLEVFKI